MRERLTPGDSSTWSRAPSLARKVLHVDWVLLAVLGLLAAIGTATLYSVAGGSFEPWAERHALRFLLGAGLVVGMGLVAPRVWINLAYPFYAVALLLLLLVPLVGTEALGARRWLTLGGFSFQPSELMKVALVAALARYYHALPETHLSRPLRLAIPLAAIAAPVVLTVQQPDLGSAVLFAIIGLSLLFLAGVSWLVFAAGAVGTLAALPYVLDNLHDYQKRRIEVFLDPDKDPLGAGYHISQSKIALGSGGLEGKGFMSGTQSRLDFLPEKHTDFAFTMFGEEWGFVGSIGLLAIYVLALALALAMALRVHGTFARLTAAGFAATLATYVLINIAMVTGLVPVVGVPLPLVSYGGTAMTSLMASLGLAMSSHVHGGAARGLSDGGGGTSRRSWW